MVADICRASPVLASCASCMSSASHTGRGIALILATTICFSTLDRLSKATNPYLPVNQILWGRYFFHGLALALLMGPRMKLDLIRTAHPWIQVLRAAILMLSS